MDAKTERDTAMAWLERSGIDPLDAAELAIYLLERLTRRALDTPDSRELAGLIMAMMLLESVEAAAIEVEAELPIVVTVPDDTQGDSR